MIGVLDYGGGNLGSVLKAIRYLGHNATVLSEPDQFANVGKLVFPGQGHFGTMMQSLTARRLLDPLREFITESRPFFGICLGLQALYEASDEAPGVPGLGILPGRVARFQGVFKVPHLGWSQLSITRRTPALAGVEDGSFAYFCHSYYGPVTPECTALVEYGQRFACVVERGNVCAVQFHPEKSADVGLKILKNFLLNPAV